MNLYTILGAAIADPEFLESLFNNPLQAAHSLGIYLTTWELTALKGILATKGLEEDFAAVARKLCPRPPCTWAIARSCDDPVSVTSAAD
jgi:hypothetical protein